MIVVDASAVLTALLNAGPARRILSDESLHAPHLIDTEVANGLRRQVLRRHIDASSGLTVLRALQQLGMTRHPGSPFAQRVWELRENLTAYDATYVALAEWLDCDLVTADARLGGAPGLGCAVTVVPG